MKVCYNCNQVGHIKANCPSLTRGSVWAPAPAALRLADGHQVKDEVLKVKGRAYRMSAEEAREAPDVVTGIS